jgi:hypothetical protein
MRDKEKKQQCKEKGITLVVIPFWWNKGIASLKATIHQTKQGFNQCGLHVGLVSHWHIEYPGQCGLVVLVLEIVL